MAAESNADVYASFGVNSAVIAGDNPQEHEQAMLELDVAARDGDDAITLNSNPKDDPYGLNAPKEEGHDIISIKTEDGDDIPSEEVDESTEGNSEEDPDFKELGDAPEELTSVSEQLGQHEEGFQAMIDQAHSLGLSEESIAAIQEEYREDKGLSPKTYDALSKVGYTKAFVDSYIRGQEALVNSYVNSMMQYAGGAENFKTMQSHLATTNPDAAQMLEDAIENRDIKAFKAIINIAGASRNKIFGKRAERSVSKKAQPAAPVSRKVKGFESQAEMIKAMSDPRYRHDAKFRHEVEQKMRFSSL